MSSNTGRPSDGIVRDLTDLDVTLQRVSNLISRLRADGESAGRRPIVPARVAAEWVGMSPRGFRKAIGRGEVPATKVGRSYVVLVDLWLERLRVQADDYAPGGGAS